MKGKKKAPDRSAYWQRYYAENLERERARKRQWYLDNRDDTIERVKATQRKADPIGPVYRVGIKRRYLIAAGRVYFNSRLGFSASELRLIAREMGAAAK
jgi:hypothetical protein